MNRTVDPVAVARRVLDAEADALRRLRDSLGEPFARAVELFSGLSGKIVCSGVGKSGHVGRKIASTLASTGQPALFVHATEASHGDLGMVGPGDAVLALSKSGETRELADVVAYAKRFAIPLVAVTEAPESALGRAADLVLALPALAEAAEAVDAPTTSTALQMALGDALAVALLERRGFSPGEFREFHPGGRLGSALRQVRDLMHGAGELPLVSPSTPMSEALVVMTEKRFGAVGVVEDGRLAGIITDGDLRRHMDGLLQHRAREVMTLRPRTLAPHMLAAEALAQMNQSRPPFTVAFVVDDDGAAVGILHVHDLLRSGVI